MKVVPRAEFKPLPAHLDRTSIQPIGRTFTREQLLHLYYIMKLARTFELRLTTLYRQGKIVGAVYVGIGQEAICTGVCNLLQPDDMISTVARNLAAWFYRGVEPKHVLARWLGKDEAPSHGRELGLFLADIGKYNIAPYHNGSMAAWIPSGAGFAWAFKMSRQKRVYVAFTGDGATSPGDFYEGLNFASIHKLPLVVIVENNQFGYSTPREKQMPVENIVDRAPAFNVYSELAFGNDIFTVMDVAGRAIEHARSGKGPVLIEFKTFRVRGHGEHDDASYVPAEMREYWSARDPLNLYVDYLLGKGGISQPDLTEIDGRIGVIIEDAIQYAESRPLPRPETVTDRLFAP